MKRFVRVALLSILAAVTLAGPTLARDPNRRPTGPVDRRECARCHAHVKENAVTHPPVAVNACSSCHRVQNAARHTFAPPDGSCDRCHDKKPIDGPVVHEPVATGECIGCHDPHGGEGRSMLRADSVDALCLGCHDGAGKSGGAHGPESKCSDCHEPHASNHAALLKSAPDRFCLDCHESTRKQVKSARVEHSPVTDERGCLNCHSAHASEHPSLLVNDLNALCLDCHDQELELAQGGSVTSIGSELAVSSHVHSAVSEGDCSTCHQSHGGDDYRLLNAAYPDQLYVRFHERRYALCFGCHDVEMVSASKTTAATGFRDGDVNLHGVHVRKKRTCKVCHRTHAGPNDRLVRSSVPYGRRGYNVTIGFEATDAGGSCTTNCHQIATYERGAEREVD